MGHWFESSSRSHFISISRLLIKQRLIQPTKLTKHMRLLTFVYLIVDRIELISEDSDVLLKVEFKLSFEEDGNKVGAAKTEGYLLGERGCNVGVSRLTVSVALLSNRRSLANNLSYPTSSSVKTPAHLLSLS